MAQYKVLKGLEYLGKRAEPGAVVSDLPSKAIKWMRECGAIELLDGGIEEPAEDAQPAEEPVVAEEPADAADAIAEDE